MIDKEKMIEIVNAVFDGYEGAIEDALAQGGDSHLFFIVGEIFGSMRKSLYYNIAEHFERIKVDKTESR